MLVVMEYCITDIDISALYNWGGCFRTFCYNNLWWLLQAPCHNYLWVVTSKESAVRKAQSSSVYHHFVFYIYKKTLQVTNLLQLKYNKNTIIKTFYHTIPNLHLRHIRQWWSGPNLWCLPSFTGFHHTSVKS